MTQKLAVDVNSNYDYSVLSPFNLKIAHDALLKYGKVSTPYLIRKLRLSYSAACVLRDAVMSDNNRYGDS